MSIRGIFRKALNGARSGYRRFAGWLDKRPYMSIIVIALVLNLLIELFSWGFSPKYFMSIAQYPGVFVCNTAIILSTLALMSLLPRRGFGVTIISVIWLGLGIINCMLLSYRTLPLSALDLIMLKSVWSVIDIYMTVLQIILVGILIALLVLCMILVWKDSPRRRVKWRDAIAFAISALMVFLCVQFLLPSQAKDEKMSDLPASYHKFGFAYCFSASIFDRGIDEPQDYSPDTVDELLDELGDENNTASTIEPNIVYLQLESFFDVNNIIGLEYSENPVPVFASLKRDNPSNLITVPTVGAGTPNTEFEILTQMNLDYFGTGEYPYQTILQEASCETINYDLKERGYSCHAIHNHYGYFYDRNLVFSNLGFDTYTSLEYMQNVETNPLGWAKDYVLTPAILEALASTPNRDFVFAVSVQPHGKYPKTVIDENQHVTVYGMEDEEERIAFEYYLNQIHETDAFLGALISALEGLREPTVLVAYGDHLPGLDIEPEQLACGDLFKTEYVIWSNFTLYADAPALEAYQLSAHVMNCLGYDNGVITKLHQRYSQNEDYQESLRLLEYDALYGERDAYEGDMYPPTKLKMGVNDIAVTGVSVIGGSTYVLGEGFTQYSHVTFNEHFEETLFVNANTLIAKDVEPEPGCVVSVAQAGDNSIPISTANDYIFE